MTSEATRRSIRVSARLLDLAVEATKESQTDLERQVYETEPSAAAVCESGLVTLLDRLAGRLVPVDPEVMSCLRADLNATALEPDAPVRLADLTDAQLVSAGLSLLRAYVDDKAKLAERKGLGGDS